MAQYFRTSTPMGDWRSFRFTNIKSGVTMLLGQLYLIQETVGLLYLDIQYNADGSKAATQIVAGEEGVLVYHIEKVMVDKLAGSGEVFLPGDAVYWSGIDATGVTPNYQDGFYWIGIATERAGADDTEVEIDLLGNKATLGAQT